MPREAKRCLSVKQSSQRKRSEYRTRTVSHSGEGRTLGRRMASYKGVTCS